MAQTSGSGGIGSLALGSIAAVVVIVGGVVLVQLGVFDQDGQPADRSLRDDTSNDAIVSPSSGTQAVPGTQVGDAGAAAPSGEDVGEDVAATTAVGQPQADPEVSQADPSDPAAEASAQDAQVQQADTEGVEEQSTEDLAGVGAEAEAGQSEGSATLAQPTEQAQADRLPEVGEDSAVPETGAAPEPSDAPLETDVASAATGSEDSANATDAATQNPPPAQEDAVLAAPQLDLVRVDPEGALVIAGRAPAGSQVQVLVDGVILEEADVQGEGEFAVFSSITPSDRPRVISLVARAGDQAVASLDQFIIAPAAPVPAPQVAEAGVTQPAAPTDAPDVQPDVEQTDVTRADVAQSASEPPLPSADVPEADADTTEAQIPAPPVAAQSAAPDQPDEIARSEVSVQTAAADTSDIGPADTSVSQSAPTSQEAPASAETAPAPVPEATAVAVLRAGADGIEVVQPAAPILAGKVALDTISYSDNGAVQLAGRARPDGLVRAYVNHRLKAELPVAEDGRWSGALGEVEPGIYTLRLDEVDTADGAVLSRLETPFKREAPEVLQIPAQEPGAAPSQPVPLVRAVTVQKGDTLWAISQQRYGSGFLYVRVFEANQDAIRDPDLIYPGQVFNLPE
jgi:nucleoid-associated protein YgaU